MVRTPRLFAAIPLVIAFLVVLALCPRTVAAQSGGVGVRKCSGGTITLSRYEAGVFWRQNHIRVDNGLKPLCVNPILERAARAHSREMLQKQYFSHDSYDGQSFYERLISFGYTPDGYRYWTVGENIAWGSGPYGRPASVMDSWMQSSGHRANILNGEYREVGVGVAQGVFEQNGGASLYTVDFGVRLR